MNRFTVFFTIIFISACSTAPVVVKPEIKDVPKKFSMYSGKPDYSVEWWKNFKNRELNNLIETAIKNNFSIIEVAERLRQARAEAVKAGAEKLPTLEYDSSSNFTTSKDKGEKTESSEDFSLGLTLSYEIDLWNRIKASHKKTSLSLQASKEDLDSAILILSGEVASCWADIVSAKKQIAYLEDQLKINEEFLKLIELRFRNASSTALDLYQQRQAIEKIKASLINLKAKRKLLKHTLALLTGRAPEASIDVKSLKFPGIIKIPDIGVPADILSSRPDVRAAGLRLKSAGWAVAAAKADRLPKISLSASYTYSSEKLKDIFSNWAWNLAANIAGPIFDGGKRKAEYERTKSVVNERIATYRKVVITAVKEVEDALTGEKKNSDSLISIGKRIELAERIVKEAEYRYLTGVSDLFPLIRENLNLLDLKQSKIAVEAELIKSRIGLYRSLGGTWMKNYEASKR